MNNNNQLLQLFILTPTTKFKHQYLHWHENLEIIFVLNGHAELSYNDHIFEMTNEDLIVINPYSIHQLTVKEGVALIYHFDYPQITQLFSLPKCLFNYNSVIYGRDEHHSNIVSHLGFLGNLLLSNISNPYMHLLLQGRIQFLMYDLYTFYSNPATEHTDSSNTGFKKFQTILEYIQHHYTENLPLKDLASTHYVTQPYISNMFQKYLNQSYTQYIVSLRLKKACQLLETTTDTLEKISEFSGFSNARSFNKYFKDTYHCTPSDYRKNHQPTSMIHYVDQLTEDMQAPILLAKSFLEKYADPSQINKGHSLNSNTTILFPEIDIEKPQTIMMKQQHLLYVGNYQHLLYTSFQKLCYQLNRDFSTFGLLLNNLIGSDSTNIFQIKNGHLSNIFFAALDSILDYLAPLKLRPIFIFDFSILSYSENVRLFQIFMEHIQIHYPSIINKIGICIMYDYTQLKYIHLDLDMLHTYFSNTNIHPKIYIHVPYDFLDYDQSMISKPFKPDTIIASFNHFDIAKDKINHLTDSLSKNHWNDIPLIMSDIDLIKQEFCTLNDSLLRMTYFANVWLENYHIFSGSLCFYLTDYTEATGKNKRLFHGANGLFTYAGLRKSSFYFFDFIQHFNGSLLYSDSRLCVTQNDHNIAILLQNPSVYNELKEELSHGHPIEYTTDYLDKYPSLIYKFSLHVPLSSKYKAHIFRLNQHHGCHYHDWLESNSLPFTSSLELMNAREKAKPGISTKLVLYDNGYLNFTLKLIPCELVLILLENID